MKKIIIIIAMILSASLGGGKAYVDHRLMSAFNNMIASIDDTITINYSHIKLSVLGSVIINDIHVTIPDYPVISIDTVEIYKLYQLPQWINVAIQGVHVPISDAVNIPILVSAFGYTPYYMTPKEVRDLGYTQINAHIKIVAQMLPNNFFEVTGTLDAQDLGQLKGAVTVNKIPLIQALRVTYTNHNFFQKIFTHLAQRNTKTVTQLKKMLIRKIKKDIVHIDSSNLQHFIQTPKRLTIDLHPYSPMSINTLLSTSPKHLRLKISSTN